jgi:hypothetical protein
MDPFDPKHAFDHERLRQARVSFNIGWFIYVTSFALSVMGTGLMLSGNIPSGSLTTSTGIGASLLYFRFAKDAQDRLDKQYINDGKNSRKRYSVENKKILSGLEDDDPEAVDDD